MSSLGHDRGWWASAVLAAVAALLVAGCDVVTQANDTGRAGWYPVSITKQAVTGGFGQIWHTPVAGAVYAQPLVHGGRLLVATQSNNVYGIEAGGGVVQWSRNLGTPWNPNDVNCPDESGTFGVTETPVIDQTTNTAYMIAKTYASGASGPAAFDMHAIDTATGNERSGFPVRLGGTASNFPTITFKPTTMVQRTGLLLLDGVVYAGPASACDTPPYTGWVVGVSETGTISTLWSAAPDDSGGPGIWQSTGGLASDGPGRILLITGNGHANVTARPGNQPGGSLGEAIVRLQVQPDHTLQATDFFSPHDADAMDASDNDLGSAAPAILPANPFSTPSHPRLVAFAGKQGYLYLLDANDLGGMKQGAGGTDKYLARLGPYNFMFGKVGVWPGDGGYLYLLPARGFASGGENHIHTFKFGVDGSGNPTLTDVATSTETAGFESTAAVVTSDGSASGSAVLWVVDRESTANTSTLRAYDAVPSNGTLQLLWSAPIGNAAKFSVPVAWGNRLFLGTNDGQLLAFAPTS